MTTHGATSDEAPQFTKDEEMQLCRSFLAIEKHILTHGVPYKAPSKWEQIATHYHNALSTHDTHVTRSAQALEAKWLVLQPETKAFVHAVETVTGKPRSENGNVTEKQIQRACQTFTTSSKRSGRPATFSLLHCWRILDSELVWRSSPAFMAALEKANTNAAAKSLPQASRSRHTKKQVKKAEEREQLQRAMRALADAMEMRAKAMEMRVKTLEAANRAALFAMPLDGMDEDAKEYFRLERAMALRNVEEEEESEEEEEEEDEDEDEEEESEEEDDEEEEEEIDDDVEEDFEEEEEEGDWEEDDEAEEGKDDEEEDKEELARRSKRAKHY